MEAVVVPEGLAAMPPGPALAAALGAIELDRVPHDRMLEVLAAQHRQLNHEQARMVATLAEVGRCETIPAPGLVARLSRPGRYAAEETRAALYWTRNAADSEHDFAESVVHAMPVVFAAWWSGDPDRPRVRVFDRYLTGLAPELIARICAVAVPVAPRRTTGQLARGRYRSRGEFLDPPLPDPTATPTEPEEQHDRIRYDDGAILRRPPPEPTQERAPPPPTDPFEPPPF
ncbi:MAG: hypothetical protein J0I49_17455 [Pseudonocardia sp.]|uniref:hypothetical protein n=1 Tax=Pseudonocardia sp. TaxID=60912 RepID=UPI001ACC0540|nr:hypothetical protein [Pseudonocardia sp.]MBN9099877.1 hypothetical protein [Pseudonocardia sp.]